MTDSREEAIAVGHGVAGAYTLVALIGALVGKGVLAESEADALWTYAKEQINNNFHNSADFTAPAQAYVKERSGAYAFMSRMTRNPSLKIDNFDR
jgi:hypothetical protein